MPINTVCYILIMVNEFDDVVRPDFLPFFILNACSITGKVLYFLSTKNSSSKSCVINAPFPHLFTLYEPIYLDCENFKMRIICFESYCDLTAMHQCSENFSMVDVTLYVCKVPGLKTRRYPFL